MGGNCPIKDNCKRFKTLAQYHNDWYENPPFDNGCDFYIPVEDDKYHTIALRLKHEVRIALSDYDAGEEIAVSILEKRISSNILDGLKDVLDNDIIINIKHRL